MQLFDSIVEKKIIEAQTRGEFENLPGSGEPLVLNDDALVPEEVRVAYRVLKNSGYVPPEIGERREMHALKQFLLDAPEGDARARAMRKLHALSLKVAEARGNRRLRIETAYLEKILNRLA